DQALQRFNRLAEGLKSGSDVSAARDLIKTMSHLYLKDHALALAARYLALLHKRNEGDGWDQVLEPLFEENAGIAVVWWRFLRNKPSEPDLDKLLKTVAALLEGKPVEGRD